MTLIITAINKNTVVQVSDRRLTRGKKLYDDLANKAICVANRDSKFSMAYTGLAEVIVNGKETRTDEWITDYLASLNAGNMTLIEMVKKLTDQMTSVIKSQKWKLEDKGLTLATAGFHQGKIFIGGISNMEDKEGNSIPVQKCFSYRINICNPTIDMPAVFMVNGLEAVVDLTFWPEIEKKASKIANQNSEKIVERLVNFIRWASQNKTCGKYIGKDCMSTIFTRDGAFEVHYHPLKSSVQSYAPHLIVPGMAFKKIEIWSGEKPPWW